MKPDQRFLVIKGFKGKGGFRFRAGDLPSAEVSGAWASLGRLIRTDRIESYSGDLPPTVVLVGGKEKRVSGPPMSLGKRIQRGLRARVSYSKRLLMEEVALAKAHVAAMREPEPEPKDPEPEKKEEKKKEAEAPKKRGRPRKEKKDETQ